MSFFISYPLSALVHISSLEPVDSRDDKRYDMKNAIYKSIFINLKNVIFTEPQAM
jgi:hypothetical protein